MPHRIEIVEGDITRLDVDAIVNAANKTLLGGGGVDGAIHRGAGPKLREACKLLAGCETGEAKITPGFDLTARYVIHTVGPVWGGGERGEDRLLANCYLNSFALGLKHDLVSIAYPAISTGAYGFPAGRAASIAPRTPDVMPSRLDRAVPSRSMTTRRYPAVPPGVRARALTAPARRSTRGTSPRSGQRPPRRSSGDGSRSHAPGRRRRPSHR